jgi:hypothetical protein
MRKIFKNVETIKILNQSGDYSKRTINNQTPPDAFKTLKVFF